MGVKPPARSHDKVMVPVRIDELQHTGAYLLAAGLLVVAAYFLIIISRGELLDWLPQ